MKTYLINLWDSVRASYWFVPTLFAIGAALLAWVVPEIDDAVVDAGMKIPDWLQTSTDTARATLSATAGAIVAVAGTVFSITIVTLSLTSQQFGPRLLRQFMYDLPTQVTLGVFLSTSMYCLLVLRVVEHRDGHTTAPHLAVLIAVIMAVISILFVILFIHHMAVLIQAPHVVESVARDLDEAIVRLFPEEIGEGAPEGESESKDPFASGGTAIHAIKSKHEGYIQAIDGETILHLAESRDAVIRLHARPGDFIMVDSPLAEIRFDTDEANEKPVADELESKLNQAVITGMRRTPRQDVECAINELVEVAVRALSPGINDPFTAMTCIDRLSASMSRLARREMPSDYRFDKSRRVRVIAKSVRYDDVLAASFDQIRRYGSSSVSVLIRLLEAFERIARSTKRPGDREAVFRHAQIVNRIGEGVSEENDREEIHRHFSRVMHVAQQPDSMSTG